MCVEIAYQIRIEREFFDREVTAVCGYFRIPSDESRAVGIEEIIRSSDVDAPLVEQLEKTVADAVLVVEV